MEKLLLMIGFMKFAAEAKNAYIECSSGQFGWQCRYDCNCPHPCDRVTGQCDACPADKWGPGCLLGSSCKYNDDTGRWYMGKKTKTVTNLPCINWVGMGYGPSRFPDDDVAGAANYCRNPDNSPYIWCYTAPHPWRMWYRCAVSSCDCPSGRFGLNCLSECRCSDKGNTCSPRTGVCQHGCHSDFTGTTCQACADRRFGIYCDKPCRCLLQHEVCNKMTGYCASGCAAGYTGNDCQKECASGRFGQNCLGICSDHCEKKEQCNKVSGNCTCQIGYQPPTCHDQCVQGRYGSNCQSFCSAHCRQPGICDRFSGECVCKAGYQPPTCHNACMEGSFGKNCVGSCRCQNTLEVCDKTDGTCAESGCAAGWHGPGCQTVCNGGRYGPNCIHTCSIHCINPVSCSKTSGTCDCQDGYQPPTCHHVCQGGTFGRNCLEACNCRDHSEACHPITGVCIKSGESGRDLVQIVAWSIAVVLYMCDFVLLLLICRQNRIQKSASKAKEGRRVRDNRELHADSLNAGYENMTLRDIQAQADNSQQDQNIEMLSGINDFVERSPSIQETLIIEHQNDSSERSPNMHEILNTEHQTDFTQRSPNMHEEQNIELQNDGTEGSFKMYEELDIEHQTEILPNIYEGLNMEHQIDCIQTSPVLYENLNMEGQEDRTEISPNMYEELNTVQQDDVKENRKN